MPDGIELFARLWRPEVRQAEKVPVVLEYIPYRTDDVYRQADDFWGEALASRGIAFARVDVRGSGNSSGELTDEYTDREIDDGVEIIAWLARQSWSNGRIGMRGISWGAINTLLIASRQPRALRAIMPIAGTDNRYTDDAHFIGGLVGHNGMQWGTLFKLFMAGPPDPAIVGEQWRNRWLQRLRTTPPILARWLRARLDMDFWAPLDIKRIRVPAYFVAGWQDTYAQPTWRMYQQLDAPKKLLVGPWGHTYPYFAAPLGLSWVDEEVAWWRSWLIHQQRPPGPEVRVFVPHETVRQSDGKIVAGHWRIGATLPATTSKTYVLGDATLTENAQPGVKVSVATLSDEHVVGQTKPEWLDRAPLEQSYDDELSHTWDSAPLDAVLTCCGEGAVTLTVRANTPVFSVAVRLCEVTADQRSWLVAYALQRVARADDSEMMTITLGLGAFAHQFQPGSRIRVAISQNLWPLAFPLGHRFVVDLHSGALQLPVTSAHADELDLPAFVSASPNAAEIAQYAIVPPDDKGQLELSVRQPPTHRTVEQGDGRRVDLGRSGSQYSAITQTQPHTSLWTQDSEMSWTRDGWRCVVRAGYELSCDTDFFQLREWVQAQYNDELVFEQDESVKLPRRPVQY